MAKKPKGLDAEKVAQGARILGIVATSPLVEARARFEHGDMGGAVKWLLAWAEGVERTSFAAPIEVRS